MNGYLFVIFASLSVTIAVQAISHQDNDEFETSHTLAFSEIDAEEVTAHLQGHLWLENKMISQEVDINRLYEEKAFQRQITDRSVIKRYQKSYSTWIEERICPESPLFDQPVRAAMTSHYGRRVHPVSGESHVHAGIDFRGAPGTPVFASSSGVVKAAHRKGAYGKTVVIEHGNQFTTLYGHLNGYAVTPGQWVNMGQTIGYIGQTGRATGPHLHFEVRCHNVPVNPRKYLGKMGVLAEVKFHRRVRGFHQRERQPALVQHDPNYYTRMINLQKLKSMNQVKTEL